MNAPKISAAAMAAMRSKAEAQLRALQEAQAQLNQLAIAAHADADLAADFRLLTAEVCDSHGKLRYLISTL